MKHRIFNTIIVIFLTFSFSVSLAANEGFEIRIKFKNLRNSYCYLGFNFGSNKYIRDTTSVNNNGLAVFKGNKNLEGGLYLVILPSKNYFEFIVTEPKISLETDTLDFIKSMKVVVSNENKAFYEYLKKMQVLYTQRGILKNEAKKIKNNRDSIAILTKKMEDLDSMVRNFRESIIKEYQGYFLAKFLKAMEDPRPRPKKPGENDTTYNKYLYEFYQYHFFDNMDFSDSRMLKTPVYESRVNRYIDELTIKNPDSVKYACERVIEKSAANDTVFRFTLTRIFNRYVQPKYMGEDAIFVYLAEKYFLNGRAYWVDSVTLNKIYTEYLKKKSNLLGMKAHNLVMKDTNDRPVSMYDIKKPYTILIFWDPDCSHCRTAMPELNEWYLHHDRDSFEIYSVSITTERKKWINFMKANKLQGINVWDPQNTNNYKMLYDAYTYPAMYVIDSKKTIQAKKIDVYQLDGLIRLINKLNQKQ